MGMGYVDSEREMGDLTLYSSCVRHRNCGDDRIFFRRRNNGSGFKFWHSDSPLSNWPCSS